jgi:4-amino-4-deoxy-L-arabinose transferase-like glycosyltransferase
MTSNTISRKPISTFYPIKPPTRSSLSKQSWLNLLTWIAVLALFVAGIWMRLHLLDVPFDRDSYDEGVYWQSLRSMSTGASLYQQIFYSQPPFFLLSIYPFYALLDQTIWSARLGIAIISLFGLLGVLLLGKALAGRLGMLLALLLLVINPLYLTESQILQADGPSTALMLLAVGLAYLWWERPDGMIGYFLATLAAITLALSMLTKLLVVPALAPVSLLVLAHFWKVKEQAPAKFFASIRPLILGCVAFVLTTVLLLLPFMHALPQFWHMVVTFHTDAGADLLNFSSKAKLHNLEPQQNGIMIQSVLVSFLGVSALYGTIAALIQRNWHVIPLLAWLGATIYVFWQQTPLLSHHLVAAVPPLIALSAMGIAPIIPVGKYLGMLVGHLLRSLPLKTTLASKKIAFLKAVLKATDPLVNITIVLAMLLALFQVVTGIQAIQTFYDTSYVNAHANSTQSNMDVARDLQQVTQQDQLVITDAQFIAAQADRSTPASLVDTSNVRIFAGYVTTQQLIEEASQPRVHAILFYKDRLDLMQPSFYNWVQQHFHLAYHYDNKKELWVKT